MWLKRAPSRRKERDHELRLKIVAIHTKSRRRYGSPRVHAKLREGNERCGRKRVARLMREERIAGRRRKRFVPKTTSSKHDHPIAENLVQRRFAQKTSADQTAAGPVTSRTSGPERDGCTSRSSSISTRGWLLAGQ